MSQQFHHYNRVTRTAPVQNTYVFKQLLKQFIYFLLCNTSPIKFINITLIKNENNLIVTFVLL